MSMPPNKRKQPESDHSVSDDADERGAAETLMMMSRDYFVQHGNIAPEQTQIQGETKVTEEKLKIQHDVPERVKNQGETTVTEEKLKIQHDVPEKVKDQGKTKVLVTEEKLKIQHDAAERVKNQGKSKVISEKRKSKGRGGIHRCMVCFELFTSGQALGGHKRAHFKGIIKKKKKVANENDFNVDLKKKAKISVLNFDLNEPVWEEGESSSMQKDEKEKGENSSKENEKEKEKEEPTDNSHQ